MSHIAKKHLLAGIIFGDTAQAEYVYLPGGGYLVDHLTLKKCSHPKLGKRAF